MQRNKCLIWNRFGNNWEMFSIPCPERKNKINVSNNQTINFKGLPESTSSKGTLRDIRVVHSLHMSTALGLQNVTRHRVWVIAPGDGQSRNIGARRFPLRWSLGQAKFYNNVTSVITPWIILEWPYLIKWQKFKFLGLVQDSLNLFEHDKNTRHCSKFLGTNKREYALNALSTGRLATHFLWENEKKCTWLEKQIVRL